MSFKSSRQTESPFCSPFFSLRSSTSTFVFSASSLSQTSRAKAAAARSKATKAETPRGTCKNQTLSKSVINLFKLVATVVFIKHELIDQQLVGCRPREGGLIYNKDGKFIYRAPKSRDGFIIVIDDRQRESLTSGGSGTSSVISGGSGEGNIGDGILSGQASNGNKQFMLELPKMGAESYPRMQILSSRVHPHESAAVAAHLAAGNQMMSSRAAEAGTDAADFYPGSQLQLINLAELQAGMSHPQLHYLSTAAAANLGGGAASTGSRSHQLDRTSSAMAPAGLPPGSLQVVPLIQLHQPSAMSSRFSADSYGVGNHMSPLSGDHDEGSVAGAPVGFHQGHQRMFGVDTPIGPYYNPTIPIDQQSIEFPFSADESADLPSPGGLRTPKELGHTPRSGSSAPEARGRFNLVDYGHLLDAHGSRVDFQDGQGMEMMRGPRNNNNKATSSLSDLIPFASPAEKLSRDGSRTKPNAEASVKHLKYSKGPSGKSKANELRRLTEVLMTISQDEADPISSLRNSSYWKQFKDQYGIMK